MSIAPLFPTTLDVEKLAPVRPRREEIASLNASIPRPTSAQLTMAEAVIRETGWIELFAAQLPGTRRDRAKGGRKSAITIDAVLVGALLLAIMERPFIIRDIARLLDQGGLGANERRRLGLDHKAAVSERMVSRMFNLMAAVINPSPYAHSNAWLFEPEQIAAYLGMEATEIDEYEVALFADAQLMKARQRLEEVIRSGLRATHPDDANHGGDYALDATFIASWENPKTFHRRTTWTDNSDPDEPLVVKRPLKPHLLADPDARWWSKKQSGKGTLEGRADSGVGYALTAVVRIAEDRGIHQWTPDTPQLIEYISVIGARGSMWKEGVKTMERMVAHHEYEDAGNGKAHRTRGDILGDREYSRVRGWQSAMHDLGFTPHFHLAKEQRGHTHTLPSGALVIDGIPYSPGIPIELRTSPKPPVFATREQRAIDADFYARREPYRLKINGGARRDDGSLVLYCGASALAGRVINCANKEASINVRRVRTDRIEIGTALPIITQRPMPAICAQEKVAVAFDQLPFWQPHIPGTAEHQWSTNRRNNIEGAFGRIKDEATQSLRRGQVRVMGLAKNTFAYLLYAMASNLAEVTRWRARQNGAVDLDAKRAAKQSRVPRRHTIKRMEDKARREEAKARRAEEAAKAAEAAAVDPPPKE